MGKSEIKEKAERPLTIGISGASGFIGSHLSAFLSARGHTVVPLPRPLFADGEEGKLTQAVMRCDAIINLAGAPINHRWSASYKKTLCDSRIETTRKLVAAIGLSPRVRLLHSVSAVGFYPSSDRLPGPEAAGDRASSDPAPCSHGQDLPQRPAAIHTASCFDETWTESDPGFLGKLCTAWEAEARRVDPRVRLVISRFGVVLDNEGGAFPLLSLPARFKMAVTIGPGSQPFPWIDLQDLMRATLFLMERPQLDGVFNFVAPGRISQQELSRLVAQHYRSWFRITAPRWLFRLLKGESAEFLTEGQCVLPDRLLKSGFTFVSPRIETFLEKL